jgi:hypothetical protein
VCGWQDRQRKTHGDAEGGPYHSHLKGLEKSAAYGLQPIHVGWYHLSQDTAHTGNARHQIANRHADGRGVIWQKHHEDTRTRGEWNGKLHLTTAIWPLDLLPHRHEHAVFAVLPDHPDLAEATVA